MLGALMLTKASETWPDLGIRGMVQTVNAIVDAEDREYLPDSIAECNRLLKHIDRSKNIRRSWKSHVDSFIESVAFFMRGYCLLATLQASHRQREHR